MAEPCRVIAHEIGCAAGAADQLPACAERPARGRTTLPLAARTKSAYNQYDTKQADRLTRALVILLAEGGAFMDYQKEYEARMGTLDEALASVRSGEQLCTSGVLCEPAAFLERFHEVVPRLENVELVKGRNRDYPFLHIPDLREHVTVIGHLFDDALRDAFGRGAVTHISTDLHNFMPNRVAYRPVDRFIAMASPMDAEGNFHVAGCGMWEETAYRSAGSVILEVNPFLPPFRGSLAIPVERVELLYESPRPLTEYPRAPISETDRIIGETVASLVHDGDCIQIGLGGMPDAVGRAFMDKRDLGLHTELFTPVTGELIAAGIISGKRKNIDTGEHVGTFVMGDRTLYETLLRDPHVRFAQSTYTNDPRVIAGIDNFVSVNTAMEIDLTGQICSESIGPLQYSGTGGAMDFAYGALHSRGGRGIMAISSTAKNGTISKIKAQLTPGAVVSVPRNAADIVVTEYGIAYLRGRTVRERALNLIAVAHPDYRAELWEEARRLLYL